MSKGGCAMSSVTSEETKQQKPLPAPNSDFYDVRSTLSPEEQDVVRQVREFAEAKVAPVVSKYWLEDAFPFELLPAFKELNLAGVGIEGYGGRGGSLALFRFIAVGIPRLALPVPRLF